MLRPHLPGGPPYRARPHRHGDRAMTEAIKRLAGHTIFASRLDALFLRNTALVVAFHRVKNTPTVEGLTVSVAMFEWYCRFFSRHFHVVPLGTLVEKLQRGQKLHRELAITFDDGYLDNFANAAPILEKHSLPATFFVVTQWIGSVVVPWWDQKRGVRHPWMTWEQVRSRHRRGFDAGAHTRKHVDLRVV